MQAEIPFTDFSRFVLDAIKSSTSTAPPNKLDQEVLRVSLELASSFLVTDTSTNPDPHAGSHTWYTGLSQLVDILVAIHARDPEELELDTINAASKACSECWTVAGTWRGLEECRDGVRKVGAKLKKLLDEDGYTYRGEYVYSPLAPTRPPPRLVTVVAADAEEA
ncbi:hypothetical protein C8F04DRAFT_1058504 [Mycena alexandri]|uniref:Uncharacterized protein n=1 Tax=Mycena alexandri TaxID=1745969 RepID=A0AAD6XCG9_9AGAR|nr:hypothetical protein C8F04DRAFT_1058504 [Mycena alexandri]